MFEVIHSMYDPEVDAGPVTWVDMQLVTVVERLQSKILELEQQVQAMNEAVASGIVSLNARITASESNQTDILAIMSPAEFIALEADARRYVHS